MRDHRALILAALLLPAGSAHAAGEPAEGPQTAVEFFQQLFGDAPPEKPKPVKEVPRPVTQRERPPVREPVREPRRAPVPFEGDDGIEASDSDIPARNPAFKGRFGDFVPPAITPLPGETRRAAPPPTPGPAPSTPATRPSVVTPSVPAARPSVVTPPVPAPRPTAVVPATPAARVPQTAPPAAAAMRPAVRPAAPVGTQPPAGPRDVFVDEEDLMEDEAILEIEEINLD
jgi:hypothetical protein